MAEQAPHEAERETPSYSESRDALLISLGTIKGKVSKEEWEEISQNLSEVLRVADNGDAEKERRRGLPIDQGGEMGLPGWGDH